MLRLALGVADDEALGVLLDAPGQREAARGHGPTIIILPRIDHGPKQIDLNFAKGAAKPTTGIELRLFAMSLGAVPAPIL